MEVSGWLHMEFFSTVDSWSLGMMMVSRTYVNIVIDVIDSTAVYWAAEQLVRSFSWTIKRCSSAYTTLKYRISINKNKENPRGL